MNTVTENIKASNEKVIETVKKAQTQVIELNVRAAGFLTEKLPSNTPRLDMNVATKAADGYFSFVGEMLAAQRDFTTRIIDVWTPEQDVAAAAPKVKAEAKSKK